ncbi:DUF2141 domain-containing protein [Aureisphaera galaxeae]|uniref:DUF2141 domain-containing protein n=1 Tax=Aureisphaera galaxeae TaxID=1538023 RepID=UPI00234FFA34|nr:DUF2141 domain-containing protein [Aureisphaera galaxeae]MDC8003526.1 DUF2141 domain-containing protein [Aureisphaera galaxeae]
MKTILTTFALIISSLFVNAQSDAVAENTDGNGTSITVNVPVPSTGGKVIFGLYDEDTFMKAAPLQGLESDIVDGKATITFTNVVPGIYAITLFHDKNDNKQMDFEPNGMPKEMYGVSNNVMNFGPPQWSDAKFEVADAPLTLEIRM